MLMLLNHAAIITTLIAMHCCSRKWHVNHRLISSVAAPLQVSACNANSFSAAAPACDSKRTNWFAPAGHTASNRAKDSKHMAMQFHPVLGYSKDHKARCELAMQRSQHRDNNSRQSTCVYTTCRPQMQFQ